MTKVGPGDWYDPNSTWVALAARGIFLHVLDDVAPQKRRELLESVVPFYRSWIAHPFHVQRLNAEDWRAMTLDDLILGQRGWPPDYRQASNDVIEALLAWCAENELLPDPRRNMTSWPMHTAFLTVAHGVPRPRKGHVLSEPDWDVVLKTPWFPWPRVHVAEGFDIEPFTVGDGWQVEETWDEFAARVSKELAKYKLRVSDDRRAHGMKPIPELRGKKGAADPDYHRKARWLVRFHVLNENQEDIARDEKVSPRRVSNGCREFRQLLDLPPKTRRSRRRPRG